MEQFITKQELASLLGECIQMGVYTQEGPASGKTPDELAQMLFDGQLSLDIGSLRNDLADRKAQLEQEQILHERRGGLSHEELSGKIMEGIVNGALSIRHEEFERQVSELVPKPAPKTTGALFAFGQELGGESDNVLALLNSLKFIDRHFDKRTLQGVYEIIQSDTAALPSEMVAAALYLRNGCTPQQAAQLADAGRLMCFYALQDAGELSPLAICTVVEHGKGQTFHTARFGLFDPETALRSAQDYAHNRQTSVTDALRFLTVHMNVAPDGAGKILTSGHDDMTKLLADAFGYCAVTAARLTFDADRDQVPVEYNPLWLELL